MEESYYLRRKRKKAEMKRAAITCLVFYTCIAFTLGLYIYYKTKEVVPIIPASELSTHNEDRTIDHVVAEPIKTARITKYSAKDSCHYPTEEGCLTASGSIATAHRTLACPYDMDLGTKVTIQGFEYTCEDRTAHWVQNELGRTFDIFEGYDDAAYQNAVMWGAPILEVQY